MPLPLFVNPCLESSMRVLGPVGSAYAASAAAMALGADLVTPSSLDMYVGCRISDPMGLGGGGGRVQQLGGASPAFTPQGTVRDILPNPLAEAETGFGDVPSQAALVGCLGLFTPQLREECVSLRNIVPLHFFYHRASDGSVITTLNEIRKVMLNHISVVHGPSENVPSRDTLVKLLRGEDGNLPIVSAETPSGIRLLMNGHYRLSALISLVADGHLPESILDSVPLQVSPNVRLSTLLIAYLTKPDEKHLPSFASFSWPDVLSIDRISGAFAARAGLTMSLREIVKDEMVAIIQALRGDHVKRRRRVAKILATTGDSRAIRFLLRVMRADAMESEYLWDYYDIPDVMGSPRVVKSLIRGVRSGDENYRRFAAFHLGDTGVPRAIKPLIQALRDKDNAVRSRAAYALAMIGTHVVESITPYLKDEDMEVRRRAEDVLAYVNNGRAWTCMGDDEEDYCHP